MIVTRRRKTRLKLGRILIPLAVVAAVVAAFVWLPSRERLHRLPPVGAAMDRVAGVFDYATLQTGLKARDRKIARLQRQIGSLQGDVRARERRISDLTTQTNQLGQQLAEAPQPRPARGAAPAASPGPSADAEQIARTAQVWNAMDPSAAAKIAERLPDDYVVQVFAKMEPDQVGEILSAMPPKLAARLTATRPAMVARQPARGGAR